jgi:hypothetical protein
VGAHSPVVSAVFVLVATIRVLSVYPVYLHTIDEPAHIACGMEWLVRGTYVLEDQHPPLARVAAAVGPRLAGAHFWGRPGIYEEGAAVLYDGKFDESRYERLLSLARAGILPFFWLACWAVYAWARRWWGSAEAALAVSLLTLAPPVLAHAGLATTDMALTAGVGAAVLAMLAWRENPGWRHSLLLGVALGGMTLTKFSSLAFFPAVAVVFLALLRNRRAPGFGRLWMAAPAVFVAGLVIWAGYRFSFGPGPWGFTIPAPELFRGIASVAEHNRTGHPAYLMGEWSKSGWPHYFLVALALKTPLPMLLLGAIGAVLAWRKRDIACAGALALGAGVLLVATFAKINIGVRHVLPVYLALALLGSIALRELFRRGLDWAAWLLMASLIAGGAAAHPDYLPYTNLLAGNEPERYIADSDLDWGQDMKRLAARLRELNAHSVAFTPLIRAHLEAVHGFPRILPSDPLQPSPGWNAVSITVWKVARFGLEDQHLELTLWPDRYKPVERVGRGTLLYYFPPAMFQPSTR